MVNDLKANTWSWQWHRWKSKISSGAARSSDRRTNVRVRHGRQPPSLRAEYSLVRATLRARETKNEPNPTSRPAAPGLRPARFANLKIFDLATGFYGSGQPARLLPAARPCF